MEFETEYEETGCIFESRLYPEETHFCGRHVCVICKDGEWEERPIE